MIRHFCLMNLLAFLVGMELVACPIKPEKYYDGNGDYTEAFQKSIDESSRTGRTIMLTGTDYRIRGGVLRLKSNVHFLSKKGSRIYTRDYTNYQSVFHQDLNEFIHDISFKGIQFDQSEEVGTQVSSRIRLCIILLYRASNVRIEDCTFKHVGTNCIAINGPDCFGTVIKGNVFHFIRLSNVGDYDVSSVYVEDGHHIISNNTIGNDGSSRNRQRGGIETHGDSGIVSGNSFYNCGNAINVVSFSGPPQPINQDNHRKIFNNIVENCNSFIVLWLIHDQSIYNVSIYNNRGKGIKKVLCVQPGESLTGSISRVAMYNNSFTGIYHVFKNIVDTSSPEHLYKHSCISVQNFGDVELSVYDNCFDSFPANIVELNSYGNEVKTHLSFQKNVLKNVFNARISEPLNLQSRFAILNVGNGAELVFSNNYIHVSNLDESIPPLLSAGGKGAKIESYNNSIDGISGFISLLQEQPIDLHLERTRAQRLTKRLKSDSISLNKGDDIVLEGNDYTCVQSGTSKKTNLGKGVLYGGYVKYIICENHSEIEIGDWIEIKGEGVPQQARRVESIVGNRVYLQGVTSNLSLGKAVELDKIAFFPFILKKKINN